VQFARELPEGSSFTAREVIAEKDARTLLREILAMSQEEFTTAFRRSAMKRAKLRGLKCNAAVVLGNIGTMEDVPVLQQALDDPEPLPREHVLARSSASRRRGRSTMCAPIARAEASRWISPPSVGACHDSGVEILL
jgi:hypothetical protein